MQRISPELSNKMSNMSVVAAFMVVVIHAGEPQLIGSSGWWWAAVFKSISKIAVPYFFVAAGFFLAGHIDEEGWWKKEVVKRIRTLLVPFAAWCLIWWLFYLPFGLYADYLHSRELWHSLSLLDGKWLRIFGINLMSCPFYSPMWFLRALFLITIISSLLAYVSRKSGIVVLLSFIAYWAITPDAYHRDEWRWFLRYGFSLFGISWFLIGMMLRIKINNWHTLYRYGVWNVVASLIVATSLLVLTILVHYGAVEFDVPIEPIFILAGLYSVFFFIPTVRWPDVLTRNAFPIYLLHSFFVFIIGIGLKNQDSWVCLSIKVILSFVGSILAAEILKRGLPKIAAVFFGGR